MPTVMSPWPTSDPDPGLAPSPARTPNPGDHGPVVEQDRFGFDHEPVITAETGGVGAGAGAGRGYHELTVDEMLADSEASDAADAAAAAAGSGLAARLDVIRQSARDGGVSVTVDLYGKLVDLTIDQRAMRQRATDLAALIERLTARATAAALTEGRAALTDALTDAGIDPAITAPDHASSPARRRSG